jgi:hypothetical protein
MKLLLEGSLVALVLMCELVGVAAFARYTMAPETHLPRQESLLIVQSDNGGGDGSEAYRWVSGTAPLSCNVVWKAQRSGDIVEVNSSFESKGGIIGEANEDCRGVHIRPHLATTRQSGVRPTTGGHRAQPTSEKSSSPHFVNKGQLTSR